MACAMGWPLLSKSVTRVEIRCEVALALASLAAFFKKIVATTSSMLPALREQNIAREMKHSEDALDRLFLHKPIVMS